MKSIKFGTSMFLELFQSFAFCCTICLNMVLLTAARGQSLEERVFPTIRPVQPPFTSEGAPPVLLAPNAYSPYANNPFARPWPANDLELRRNIRMRFAQDSFLHPFGIHVEVREGMATLTGTADTIQDRDRAALDAYAAGAVNVDNELQVKSQ